MLLENIGDILYSMKYDKSNTPLLSLLSSGRHHKFPKGQVIQFENGRIILCVLNTGYVKRYIITNDGSKSIQSIYGPGDIFPLTPVFKELVNRNINRGQEIIYYEAMTPAILHSIDRKALRDAVTETPEIYKDLLYVSGCRLSTHIHRLENMSLKNAYHRVAHQLVYYAGKFGQKNKQGTIILLPLTHQILADILNLARETFTNSMVKLHEKNLIIDNKNIIVTDVEKLRRVYQ